MQISSGFLLLAGMILYFFVSALQIALQVITLRNTNPISDINDKVSSLDHVVSQLKTNIQLSQMENTLNDVLKDHEPGRGTFQAGKTESGKIMYRSADGKHVARSIDELLMKMATDPESSIDPADIEALKRIFEKIDKSIEDPDDDDEWEPSDDEDRPRD